MTDLLGARIHGEIWDSDYDETCERGDLDVAESHAEFCRRLGVDMSYDGFATPWPMRSSLTLPYSTSRTESPPTTTSPC